MVTDNVMMDKGKEKEGDDLYLVKRSRVFSFNAHLSPISASSSPPPQLAHPRTPWQPPPAVQSHVSNTTTSHLPSQQSLLLPSSSTTTSTTNRIESSPSPPQSLPPPQPTLQQQPAQSMHSISSILSPQPTSSSPPRSVSDPSTASSSSSQGSTSPAGVTGTTTTATSNPSSASMQSAIGGPKVEIMYQDGRMVPSSRPKRMRRGPVEPKMRRVQPLEKDPVSGEYKLPARVGILTVHSLGRVVPLPTYHNDRYIWPPGFKVSRYVVYPISIYDQ